MTYDSILSWMRQCASIGNTVNQLSEAVDSLRGQLHVANATENAKHIAAINTDLDRLTRDLERVTTAYLSKTNTTSPEAARTLLEDISIRLDNASQLHKQWRLRLSQYEHLATLNEFTEDDSQGGISRKQMNEIVEDAQKQYQTALENAGNLIPNRAVVVL